MTFRGFIFPLLILLAFILIILLLFGAPISSSILFFLYELFYVIIPGILVFKLILHREESIERIIVFGWSLGYLLEIISFIVFSSLKIRNLFIFYPIFILLFVGINKLKFTKNKLPKLKTYSNRNHIWILCLLILLFQIYIATSYFIETPLPENIKQTNYDFDVIWHLSLAGQIKNNWPLTDPSVSNEPLYYYYFSNVHIAAISWLTNIPLHLVVFRYYLIPQIILLILELYILGLSVTRKAVGGILAIILFLFLGELDPFISMEPFFYHLFLNLYTSPSFLLGLIFFIPIIVLLYEEFIQKNSPEIRKIIPFFLFFIGVIGSKGSLFPIIVASCCLYFIYYLLRFRKISRSLLTISLLIISFSLAIWLLGYQSIFSIGDTASGIHPLIAIQKMQFIKWLDKFLNFKSPILIFIYLIIGLVGMFGIKILGIIWAFRYPDKLERYKVWLLTLFIVSFVPYLFILWPANSQEYFSLYSVVPASALAAYGIYNYFKKTTKTILVLILILVFFAFVDIPVGNINTIINKDNKTNNNEFTKDLFLGTQWLNKNTKKDAVIAVNNHYLNFQKIPRYFYYSAFSERKIFLEGWGYSSKKIRSWYSDSNPFPERFDLNNRVFIDGDLKALNKMASDYGVSYLFVDKIHGEFNQLLIKQLELVFSNNDVDIYRIKSIKT